MGGTARQAAVDAAVEAVAAARAARGTTWGRLAEVVGAAPVWAVAALQGQHRLTGDQARAVAQELGLDAAVLEPLTRFPYRGGGDPAVPSDPTLYRFHEALAVYGPALKELIHEEFGDGIMSAINFRLSVERRPDPGGDRVVVTFDGKFLPYQW